ncbi:MAG: hypothetical protein OXI24_04775 [Candidatus Poribacteria bacterium]|nr:hypothetical protein [Candidatus Poribacteria bacterium]
MFIVKYPEVMINLNHIKEIRTESEEGDYATLYVVSPDGTRTDFCTEDADLVYNSLAHIAVSISANKQLWRWDSYAEELTDSDPLR